MAISREMVETGFCSRIHALASVPARAQANFDRISSLGQDGTMLTGI